MYNYVSDGFVDKLQMTVRSLLEITQTLDIDRYPVSLSTYKHTSRYCLIKTNSCLNLNKLLSYAKNRAICIFINS